MHPCLICPTGAVHAGRPGEGRFAPAEALRDTCERCRRPASRGLSGRMVWGRFCVSCYNRHREAVKGANAKGGQPTLALRDVELAVERGGAVRPARHRRVASAAEAMLAEAKRATGPLAFVGAPSPTAGDDEWRLAPHVCRSCLGRVMERAGVFRCPDCGGPGGTTPEAVCGCGLQPTGLPARHLRLFRCRTRPRRAFGTAAEVVIAFGDELDGADARP